MTHTDTHNLALIFPAHAAPDTYQTSVSSLEWHPTYVVQPLGCPMPLCLHSPDWLSEWVSECVIICLCVCVCVVWLQGRSHVEEWAPALPRWQAWPQRVIVHYHMKPKCQPPPPLGYSHLSFAVGQSLPGHLHSNTNTLTCYFLSTHKYTLQEGSDTGTNLGGTTNASKVERNPFVPITLRWSVAWLTDWTQLLTRCLYLSYLCVTNLWYLCRPHSRWADTH